MKLFEFAAVLVLVLAFIGTAQAQQDVIATANINWAGSYIGGSMGGGWNSTCDNRASGTGIKGLTALTNTFYHRNWPNDGTFISGAQIGCSFQYDQWVWGFGVDYEAYSGKNRNRTYTCEASPAPDGTYTFSCKNSADGFFIVGPRISYVIDAWLPYFRLSGVFTSGSRHFTTRFTYTPGTATFSGGGNYDSSGFGAGAGVEYGMVDRWTLRSEYAYMNLGEGDNSVSSCRGAAATCARSIELDNIHNSVTASIFRWAPIIGFDRGLLNARVATIER
jgi:outer membrane immunogenic protein